MSGLAEARPRLVLLHGWGSSAAVFAALAGALAEFADVGTLELPAHGERRAEPFPRDSQRLLDWLHARVPAGVVLVGWSLGGQLALRLALRHPRHLAALVTIATSPCFLRKPDWPFGMAPSAWDAFRTGLAHDPAAQLARFAALQAHGDRHARELVRELRAAAGAGPESAGELLAALDELGASDLREQLAGLRTASLHVLGERDAIVDARVADELLRLQPQASVWVVPGAAHAPLLGAPRALAARIADFIALRGRPTPLAAPRKHAIAASFGRAAPGYEAAATLQRLTGNELLATLEPLAPRRVLDLGSGTGHFAAVLAGRFTQAAIVGIDLAEGMVHHARSRERGHRLGWVCGDAERLPLAAASVELVFSNLALQWCASPLPAFLEIARVLAPGGRAAIATLAEDTLWELRAAWRAVDDRVHVNRFDTVAGLTEAAWAAGLRVRTLTQRCHRPAYADVGALARELRALGAHNLNPGRASGLAGRASWRRLQEAYAVLANPDGSLPASWRVVYLVLEKRDD